MELADRQREASGIAADLVERSEPQVSIERGVLDAFRHHRPCRLLPAHDELVESGRALTLQQHDAAELVRKDLRRAAILVVDPPGSGLDIRAVDVERGRRRLEPLVWEERAKPLELGSKDRPCDLELRLVRDRREAAALAGQLGVELGQRRLAGGVDEERGNVVCELVARRALDRPVAEALSGLEDLLDPHALDTPGTQALEVLARVGEPIRMVDAQAVDEMLLDELENLGVAHLEHVRVLDPDAGEIGDVEKTPMPIRARIPVEELRPHALVGPERILVRRRHVVRDHVEDDSQACRACGGAEPAKLVLSTEVLRDARRIDDVVAVRRAVPGL